MFEGKGIFDVILSEAKNLFFAKNLLSETKDLLSIAKDLLFFPLRPCTAKKGNGAPLFFFSNAAGFSLVEVLVAMTILSIGILGITGLAGTSVNTGAFAQNMTQATNIAQDRIEALQSIPYRNLHVTDTATARTDLRRTCTGPTGPVSRPVYACTPSSAVTMGSKTFTWTYTVAFIDLNADGTANELSDGLKRLDVAVTWGDTLTHTNKTTSITTVVSK